MADITYCGHLECTSRECMRHHTNAPSGRCVSWAMFDCPYIPLDTFDGYDSVIHCYKCRHHFCVDGDEICRRPGLNGEMIVAPYGFCAWGESKNGSI